MKNSWIGKIAMGLVVVLVGWNIYKGLTVQEIGIPGCCTFKFGKSPVDPNVPSDRVPSEIEVDGRVVDFEKAVLVVGADVRLTVANTIASQKTDSDGGFIFKVPGRESNAVATLEVTASGYEPYSQNLSPIASVRNVYLKHASGGAGSGAVARGAAIRVTPEQAQRIAKELPAYQKRRDAIRLIPHR